MRCGKEALAAATAYPSCRNPHECAVAKNPARVQAVLIHVATRTNALWQSSRCCRNRDKPDRRNPHECAVAKKRLHEYQYMSECRNPHECAVAKDRPRLLNAETIVATRTNALWQSSFLFLSVKVICVATRTNALWQSVINPRCVHGLSSQPARMRCGKVLLRLSFCSSLPRRNPHECAVAKIKWRKAEST